MENILVIVSIIVGMCGIAGFVLSIINAAMHTKELAEERELHAKELAEERELHAKELAEERELHAKERAEEKELHAQELAEERELHAQEREMYAQEREIQKQELARNNRLTFLADRIFDSTIPRELRLPFYEEYISMKGNGTAVRFWLLEGEREKKQSA